jgi:segregation and condensation protein B
MMGTVSEPTTDPTTHSTVGTEQYIDLREASAVEVVDLAAAEAVDAAEPPAAELADAELVEAEPAAGQEQLDLDAMPAGARGALEAVLMVVEEPVDEVALASALGLTVERATHELHELAAEYDEAGRGFELRRIAGGWRMFSRAEYAAAVERFVLDGQTARLTQAALETLAIVAYRQPVSRARVGAVRGVNVDAVMRTLVTRGLVEEAGHDPETGAVLYRTTTYFLQRLGLTSLDELPALAPFLPEVDALEELGVGGAA